MTRWQEWAGFDTFGDPEREDLVKVVGNFCLAAQEDPILQAEEELRQRAQGRMNPNIVKTCGPPRWLTMVGKSNTGKTHMAKRICKWWADQGRRHFFSKWPIRVEKLRKREILDCEDLRQVELLVLDEIGGEVGQSDFSVGELCKLLESRLGKWTVITSNQSFKYLGQLDGRIPARIIREPNQFIELTCENYFTRKARA
jgi:DNA replication protein DnaC